MALFLLNPLTVASCVGGTTTTAETCAVVALLWLCARRRWLGAAAALAACVYLGLLHGALLLVSARRISRDRRERSCVRSTVRGLTDQRIGVRLATRCVQIPAALLLVQGPEPDALPAPSPAAAEAAPAPAPASAGSPAHPATRTATGGLLRRALLAAVALAALAGAGLLALVWLSDRFVAPLHPPAACLPHAPALLAALGLQGAGTAPPPAGAARQCWAHAVWRLHLLVEDQTPNIGQLWYFMTEMFQLYLPFFR